MSEPQIPEKLYFKIGEVSKIVGVKPYVLRYWETEFKEIGPIKSRSNQRLYRRKDVEALLAIRKLLYQDGFTISGARKKVKELMRGADVSTPTPATKSKKAAAKAQISLIDEAIVGEAGTPQAKAAHQKLFQQIKQELLELQKMIQIGA